MIRVLTSLALLILCGASAMGQDPTLELYKTLIKQGTADYRGAVPKVIDYLKKDDEKIAVQATEILQLIGKKLEDSDVKGDDELRLTAAKALLRASLNTKKEKLAPAAKKAVEAFSTKKERETLLKAIKDREEEKKKEDKDD